MEQELIVTQFRSSYETYQICIVGTLIQHLFTPLVSPSMLVISAIYFPISGACCIGRYFLHQMEDQVQAHMLCQRLWMASLSVGPGLQWVSIQLGYHPLVGTGEAVLYMFAYTIVITTMHIMHFDVQTRLTCMLCMFLSLSTSGWGGWSGERGWTALGQPYDTVIIFLALVVGSLFGYTIERMMRASFSQRQQLLEEREGEYRDKIQAIQASAIARPAPELQADIAAHSFETLGLLGRGGSGEVFLVRRRRNEGKKAFGSKDTGEAAATGKNELLALKRIVKVGLSKTRSDQLLEECRIIQQLKCPFIVQLEEAFQTRSCVYLAMTYAGGGNLTLWLDHFTASSVRVVAAEVLLALRYLHSISVIYRDLKLENTLVATDGHVLLSDFGVSKRLRVTLQQAEDVPLLPGEATSPRSMLKEARTVVGTVREQGRVRGARRGG